MATNLISCDNCAVVLDVDKLSFVDNNHYHKDDGSINEEKVVLTAAGYMPYVSCPVCEEKVILYVWGPQ